MYRVGILTFYHRVYNYGAMLQAYALCKTINEMGEECKQITYNRDTHGLFYRKIKRIIQVPGRQRRVFITTQLDKIIGKLLRRKPTQFTANTKKAFDEFENDIPHTKIVDRDTIGGIVSDFDLFIVGSDQVWNPEFVTMRYFFDFLPNDKRRSSYAASIRIPKYEKKEGAVIKELLDKFEFITVREKKSIQILKDIGVGKNIEVVLDPTMLVTATMWKEMLIEPKIEGKYIVSYLIRDESVRRKIESFANERGLKIVDIVRPGNEKRPNGELYISLDYIGPREFVGLIKNAEYVFPDSFHGTALSVIFNKRFAVISGDKTDDRKTTILSSLGLDDRVVSPDGSLDSAIDKEIDYHIVNMKLESLRMESIAILKKIVFQE